MSPDQESTTMGGTRYSHHLHGCRPVPLAHYLGALGILRLVTEQADPSARGCWERDVFVLETTLSRNGLERFFLEQYAPTPIVGPWGARSGFLVGNSEKTARTALDAIIASEGDRLGCFRETIIAVRTLLRDLGVSEKEEQKERKAEILQACRARLSDDVMPWLDACYVLTRDGGRYPPLLGTGGNEGSGSYTSGFAQQVVECIIERKHDHALGAALWDLGRPDIVTTQLAGHFLPSAIQDKTRMNPWEYLLCLEGALVFAGALVRRGEAARASSSFPFTVQSVIAGYGSAAEEKNRGELWLPLWERPCRLAELVHLFSEGRSELGRRRAKSGSDFARAVCTLGVDRGLTSFQRYGIQERNGQANLAIPLDRLGTNYRPHVALLGDIDAWLQQLRRRAGSSGDRAPGSVKRCAREIDEAILALCTSERGDGRCVRIMLVALGRCEQAMARSVNWAEEARVSPVPPLSSKWLAALASSVELRLAAALMSVHAQGPRGERYAFIRQQFEPVEVIASKNRIRRIRWDPQAGRDVVWSEGNLVDSLNRIMHRRLILAGMNGAPSWPDRGVIHATSADIADFIEGRVDERELAELIWALALLDWSAIQCSDMPALSSQSEDRWPGALYAVLSLCFAPAEGKGEPGVPLVPRIHRLASTGRGMAASRAAVQRLRASGLAPSLGPITMGGECARRTAAALLFPLDPRERGRLRGRITRTESEHYTTYNDRSPSSQTRR